ncbi:RNA polymerase sigma factor [Anaerosporobacter sp.]|uniref:RNA polymerase sigma factor n=1 Tax=Anaerosporobacter sp. TaxID=1872529 RepID=UPI00286F661B|nr:RNA polymerase sigma factor [Anaerosporobacter sp.]
MAKFSKIYDEYANKVYHYLLALTRDEQIAEELTQDTFYKAMLHIHQFKEQCSMFTWLCQIGKNTYISWYRKQKFVDQEAELQEMEFEQDFVKDMVSKEQSMKVHKVLHSLEEPYKEVFNLRVFGELKFKEIGEIFDKSEVWAKVTYYRAKAKIMERMEEWE